MKKTVLTIAATGILVTTGALPAFADDGGNVNVNGGNSGTINVTYNNNSVNNNYTVNFDDIDGNWANQYIKALVKEGILHGEDNHHFNPDGKVKRDEFAQMVTNYFHLTNTSTSQDFADVTQKDWFFNAVEASKSYMTYYEFPGSASNAGASSNTGISSSTGTSANAGTSSASGTVSQSAALNTYYFLPEKPAQRQSVVTTLVKLLYAAGKIQLVTSDQANTILANFKDGDAVSPDLRIYVATAIQSNLMKGDADSHTLRPEEGLKRDEAATLLYRIENDMQVAAGTPINAQAIPQTQPIQTTDAINSATTA